MSQHQAQHVNFPVLILCLLSRHFGDQHLCGFRAELHSPQQQRFPLNLYRQLHTERVLVLAGEGEGDLGTAGWLLQTLVLKAKLEKGCAEEPGLWVCSPCWCAGALQRSWNLPKLPVIRGLWPCFCWDLVYLLALKKGGGTGMDRQAKRTPQQMSMDQLVPCGGAELEVAALQGTAVCCCGCYANICI